jgi:hypothetical protein
MDVSKGSLKAKHDPSEWFSLRRTPDGILTVYCLLSLDDETVEDMLWTLACMQTAVLEYLATETRWNRWSLRGDFLKLWGLIATELYQKGKPPQGVEEVPF